MKILTNTLTGRMLDYAAAKAMGFPSGEFEGSPGSVAVMTDAGVRMITCQSSITLLNIGTYWPSMDGDELVKLIANGRISIDQTVPVVVRCSMLSAADNQLVVTEAPDLHVAVIRCLVEARLGLEVDIPERMVPENHRNAPRRMKL
ncbi:hypothetical protein ACKF11_13220 [Methylobacillus sp. Pita2]|uniref:hypothetical protein n=1 Tax=Methylobacillus sp. Pita2 TaxID=3383245 RepID=UPI0038B50618